MIAITYRNGKVWALGANKRYRKDRYLQAMITPDLSPANRNYVFIYVSLRDVVELMQQLDDRVPVFFVTFDYPSSRVVNERRQWKEILQNMNRTKKPVAAKQSPARGKRQIRR